MKELFYYIFYRASKFYKDWGEEKFYYISGEFALFLALITNILTIIGLLCILLKIKYGIEVIYAVCFVFFILSFFILNEKKYKELAERYKDEKNSKLKGRFVFAYIIGSVILYFVSLALLG